MERTEGAFEPCPLCGDKPITDPNARPYISSAAWECGTIRAWVRQDKIEQSHRCKDQQESTTGHES